MGTTETDPVSIMCCQLPGEIMRNGRFIPGGRDTDSRDYAFAASIYPKNINKPKKR